MPQMMPLNWTILYILFNITFYIFLVHNYFNLNFQTNNPQPTPMSTNYSKSIYNFWPLN